MLNSFELKPCLFPRGKAGLCCDEGGVALGPVRLVEKCDEVSGKRYRICPPEVFARAFITAYGKPPLDVIMYLWEGIGRVTKSLEERDLTLAMMKATFLGFPEIELENMAKLEAGEWAKYNSNHDIENGRLTGVGGAAKSAPVASAEAEQYAHVLKMAMMGSIGVEKAGYDPNECRDEAGRWCTEEVVVTGHGIQQNAPAMASVGKINISRYKNGGDPRVIANKLKRLSPDVLHEIE